MAAITCWDCMAGLIRKHSAIPARHMIKWHFESSSSAFSTSAILTAKGNAVTKRKPNGREAPKRGAKSTYSVKKKKKGREGKARPPAVGERKAMRKRVVLTNKNAIEVENLPELDAETISMSKSQGIVFSFPGTVIDQLKTMEAFQPRQNWGLFRRPSILIRKESLKIAEIFKEQENGAQSTRRILIGERSSGKSVLMLQAMATAFLKNWIVISIPEARDLTIGHTAYAPVPNLQLPKYFQKDYTAALLERVVRANPVLSQIKAELRHTSLPVPLPKNASLERLCAIGYAPEFAYPVFQALWEELTAPSRPPIMLSLDGLSRAMAPSSYMSPSFKPIHALDLALISWFMDYLSGRRALPNGGAILAATSESNVIPNVTLDISLRQLEAQQALQAGTLSAPSNDPVLPFLEATGQSPTALPQANPFLRYDERVFETLGRAVFPTFQNQEAVAAAKKDTHLGPPFIQRLSPIGREEARSLMEYWARSGMIRGQVDDQLVSQKWTLSGGGVLGELEKACLQMRLN